MGCDLVGHHLPNDQIGHGRVCPGGRPGVVSGGRDHGLGQAVSRRQVRCHRRGVAPCVVIRSSARPGPFTGVHCIDPVTQVAGIERGPLDVDFIDEELSVRDGDADCCIVGHYDLIARSQVNLTKPIVGESGCHHAEPGRDIGNTI